MSMSDIHEVGIAIQKSMPCTISLTQLGYSYVVIWILVSRTFFTRSLVEN